MDKRIKVSGLAQLFIGLCILVFVTVLQNSSLTFTETYAEPTAPGDGVSCAEVCKVLPRVPGNDPCLCENPEITDTCYRAHCFYDGNVNPQRWCCPDFDTDPPSLVCPLCTGTGTGTDTGTTTGTDTGTTTGTDTGTTTGTDTGTTAGTNTGTATGANTGTTSGLSTGTTAGTDTGTGTGSNTGANTGTGTGTNAGASAGTNTGMTTGTTAGSNTGSSAGSSSGTDSGSSSGSSTGFACPVGHVLIGDLCFPPCPLGYTMNPNDGSCFKGTPLCPPGTILAPDGTCVGPIPPDCSSKGIISGKTFTCFENCCNPNNELCYNVRSADGWGLCCDAAQPPCGPVGQPAPSPLGHYVCCNGLKICQKKESVDTYFCCESENTCGDECCSPHDSDRVQCTEGRDSSGRLIKDCCKSGQVIDTAGKCSWCPYAGDQLCGGQCCRSPDYCSTTGAVSKCCLQGTVLDAGGNCSQCDASNQTACWNRGAFGDAWPSDPTQSNCCDMQTEQCNWESGRCCGRTDIACGSNCCKIIEEQCVDPQAGVCCPSSQACGTTCCPPGESCINMVTGECLGNTSTGTGTGPSSGTTTGTTTGTTSGTTTGAATGV
jgi:hypothetical protein